MLNHQSFPTQGHRQAASALRFVQCGEPNRFARAVDALRRTAESIDGPLAIVGGLAGIAHHAALMTSDIDVVVPRGLVDAFLMEGEKQGITLTLPSPDGWHRLVFRDTEGDVPLSILPEGGRCPRDPADAPRVPSPNALEVNQGVGYASFAGWVILKLVADRPKDRFHLIECFRRAELEQLTSTRFGLQSVPGRYQSEFERLVRAAREVSTTTQ